MKFSTIYSILIIFSIFIFGSLEFYCFLVGKNILGIILGILLIGDFVIVGYINKLKSVNNN